MSVHVVIKFRFFFFFSEIPWLTVPVRTCNLLLCRRILGIARFEHVHVSRLPHVPGSEPDADGGDEDGDE